MKVSISRKILMVVTILVLFFIQINLSFWFPSFTSIPNLMLIAVFSFAFLQGSMQGMAAGVLCGILTDLFQGEVFGFYTFLFICLGYINGLLRQYFTNHLIVLPFFLCIINQVIYHLIVYCFGVFMGYRNSFFSYMRTVIMPEFLLTFLASVILYGLILWMDGALGHKKKEGEMQIVS